MNTNLKNYVMFLLLLIGSTSYAQKMDNERMKRDIEVAENILSTLVNQESDIRFGNNMEGTYIDGYGVLFTIGNGSFYKFSYGSDVAIRGYSVAAPNPKGKWEVNEINQDSFRNTLYTQVKDVMKTFVTDYAHLLSQLQPTEKVLLRYGQDGRFSNFVIAGTPKAFSFDSKERENPGKELTAEITKAALDEARAGKLTKAQLEERIKFTEKMSTAKKDAELELLSSIFNRLYQDDLSEIFRMRGNPTYEKIEGLGAVFNLNFGGNGWGKGFTIYSSDNLAARAWKKEGAEAPKAETEEEENQKMKAGYPKFIEQFKQNVIEYGRTVHNLAANELLIFKLSFCSECGLAESVEVSVKKSVLEDFDKNKMNLEQAVQQVKVKSSEKQD